VSAELDGILAQFRSVLRCDTREAQPACTLPIRFDHQVLRANPPEVVFAQILLGFELMEQLSRYVGVNLVQPEDDPVALRDYRLHMRMVGFLRDVYDRDRVTLHAGELTAEVAPADDLRFHIREAVTTAGADRIGHGVDIAGEDGVDDLLAVMAERHVLVEIAFTSNDQILGVAGDEHPFPLYRRAGVPVTLVTDDEGVSRSDLTAQYQQAAATYGLSYRELRTLARAAVQHGFLPGADLWVGPDDHRPAPACAANRPGEARPRPACRALLRSSPKAAAEWRQEAGFTAFERRYGG
ncbi:MAG: adenosine deaminase, partial [Acidimicrobiia bacterium]